jgi:hypothetical protein
MLNGAMLTATVPVFFTVTSFEAVGLPTVCVPKENVRGETEIMVAVPLRLTD